jgi:hypothetical protein
LTFQTFSEWKNWAIRSNSAWELGRLKQMKRGDQRVWIYADGSDYLFFPGSNESENSISRVTCVNPLGCYLTEGKTYEIQGQEDGLLLVSDDLGMTQFFLPERFTDDHGKISEDLGKTSPSGDIGGREDL